MAKGPCAGHTRLCLKLSVHCVLKHEAVELWLKAGVTPNKLVLGVAAYGRTQRMTSANLHAPGDPADTALPTVNGPLSRSPGTYAYFEVTLHSILRARTSDIVIMQSTLSALIILTLTYLPFTILILATSITVGTACD